MFFGKGPLYGGIWLLAWLVAVPAVATAKPTVTGVRLGEHVEMTRFVLDISERVDYRIFTLSNPYRVIIDLPEIDWRVPSETGGAVGLIRGRRYGLFRPGTSRVVLDVAAPVEVHRAFLLAPRGKYPYRFVVDLRRVDEKAFRETARLAAPLPPAATTPRAQPRPRPEGKHVIVIDPGHGGVDPGTIGVSGKYEKHITLAIARELKTRLAASGRFEVSLTRDRDVFMRLRDRVGAARDAGADLFISLHADSIKNRRLRGASVYTLSEKASDKEAAALAARENKADIIAGVDFNDKSDEVANILIDLAQRESMNLSARFANVLLPEIANAGRVLRRSHRFAGFAVLKAPDVPSVLIELGYLSNREDERTLASTARRKKLVLAIVRAVTRYFEALAG